MLKPQFWKSLRFFLVGLGILMLMYTSVWGLWCTVGPYLWPTGLGYLISPGYWSLMGVLWLLRVVYIGVREAYYGG